MHDENEQLSTIVILIGLGLIIIAILRYIDFVSIPKEAVTSFTLSAGFFVAFDYWKFLYEFNQKFPTKEKVLGILDTFFQSKFPGSVFLTCAVLSLITFPYLIQVTFVKELLGDLDQLNDFTTITALGLTIYLLGLKYKKISLEEFENYLNQMLKESKEDFQQLESKIDDVYKKKIDDLQAENKELKEKLNSMSQTKNILHSPFISDRFEKQK